MRLISLVLLACFVLGTASIASMWRDGCLHCDHYDGDR